MRTIKTYSKGAPFYNALIVQVKLTVVVSPFQNSDSRE
jgi:hypothetical protein